MNSDLSILIKTFIRPICLENLLKSIQEYQECWGMQFENIVIIDDSDLENKELNQNVVKKYNMLNITYKQYDFNSLGLSKGRNEGLSLIHTKYFILCDDDFIFDVNCSFENNIKIMEEKNLDILGGIYRNIESIDSVEYSSLNWLGFIQENEEFDVCSIYEDIFPEYMDCHICQNFFIGKTETVKKTSFPEDLPILEHNIFYLRAKQNGLRVASTSKLYVKHLHLNANKNYSSYRNREVVNPIKKRVVGTLITKNDVFLFDDYLNVAKYHYELKNNNIKSKNKIFSIEKYKNNFIRRYKITFLGLKFSFKFKKRPNKKTLKKLKQIESNYPKVMSTCETLNKVILEHKSIARFGDGEIKLIMGQGLGEKGSFTEYQVFDEQLMKKLQEILKNPSEECLVCIDAYKDRYNDIPNYKNGLSYYENFWLENYEKVEPYYNKNYHYGITSFIRNTGFIENKISKYRQIWDNRKVLFVIGNGSHWVNESRLFDNIITAKYIVTKGRSSYEEYDNILEDIKSFNKDWLILLAIGPTSTVLAYELSKLGYQALDIGHMPNCYLQAIGERKSPEIEHFNNKQFVKEIGIYEKI